MAQLSVIARGRREGCCCCCCCTQHTCKHGRGMQLERLRWSKVRACVRKYVLGLRCKVSIRIIERWKEGVINIIIIKRRTFENGGNITGGVPEWRNRAGCSRSTLFHCILQVAPSCDEEFEPFTSVFWCVCACVCVTCLPDCSLSNTSFLSLGVIVAAVDAPSTR